MYCLILLGFDLYKLMPHYTKTSAIPPRNSKIDLVMCLSVALFIFHCCIIFYCTPVYPFSCWWTFVLFCFAAINNVYMNISYKSPDMVVQEFSRVYM